MSQILYNTAVYACAFPLLLLPHLIPPPGVSERFHNSNSSSSRARPAPPHTMCCSRCTTVVWRIRLWCSRTWGTWLHPLLLLLSSPLPPQRSRPRRDGRRCTREFPSLPPPGQTLVLPASALPRVEGQGGRQGRGTLPEGCGRGRYCDGLKGTRDGKRRTL